MSGFDGEIDPHSLIDEDLREIYKLKRQERPHLSNKDTFGEDDENGENDSDNIWVKYDLPLWRSHELNGEAWEELKRRLLESVVLGNEVAIVEGGDVREKVRLHERENRPVLIRGLMESWSGYKTGSLTFRGLRNRFPQVPFRFSDTHGGMLDLETYGAYCLHPLQGMVDDSPLAVYDSEFGDDDMTSPLLQEYEVPTCFGEDLFHLAEEAEEEGTSNPPYRWILCGPPRR